MKPSKRLAALQLESAMCRDPAHLEALCAEIRELEAQLDAKRQEAHHAAHVMTQQRRSVELAATRYAQRKLLSQGERGKIMRQIQNLQLKYRVLKPSPERARLRGKIRALYKVLGTPLQGCEHRPSSRVHSGRE